VAIIHQPAPLVGNAHPTARARNNHLGNSVLGVAALTKKGRHQARFGLLTLRNEGSIMRLSFKFSLLILALLVVTLGASAWRLMNHQRQVVQDEVEQRAKTVLSFGEANRDYARNVLSPAVRKKAKGLIFEADSATFVARGTFLELNKRLPEYSFREASLNPLNNQNRADATEEQIIHRLQKNPNLKEITGFRVKDGKEQFYIARPIVVKQVCLQCHDTPDRAPKEVVARYGREHGFGWKEGDLTNAIMVTVPADDLRAQQKAMMWKIGGIFIILAGVLIVGIVALFEVLVNRRLRRTAAVLQEVADNPATRTRIADPTRDEIGGMGQSVNGMLDKVLPLMEARQQERDAIQGAVMKLLDEVSGVAQGDLTKEAEVSADVTGAIADSFNYMIEQLRKIIGNVQMATLHVSSSANTIRATADQLVEGSETQAQQIVTTTAALDDMTTSIRHVSENAGVSATVAQQAMSNARQGNEAVQNTIEGMNRIRDQVQETAKRIKRLGESSQEIGQIIQLIDDIADRTSILALNASIQASMAGEAGRGFAVVAGEVERLAERSTDATKKIATLIKTIQSETGEAVTAMEKGIQEVVEGSKLANQAGQALAEIETVSSKLAELIHSISQASGQQARGSEALAKSMTEISHITQHTAAGTRQAAASVSQLATLADSLRASVSAFRLPEDSDLADSKLDLGGPEDSFIIRGRNKKNVTNGSAGAKNRDALVIT
jgi:twitching motility protein PilJ